MAEGVITFYENKLSFCDLETTSALFAAGSFPNDGTPIEEIFSDETLNKISHIKLGTRQELKVATRADVMLDAVVSRLEVAPNHEQITVYFPELPATMRLSKERAEATQYGYIAMNHYKTILRLLASLENKKSMAIISQVRAIIINFMSSIMRMFDFVRLNDVKNSALNFACVNIWSIISELENEINSVPNAEIVNNFYSCYNVHISIDNIKMIILALIRYLSGQGQRAYVKCAYDDECATVTVSNFKHSKSCDEVVSNESNEEIGFCFELCLTAMDSGAQLERKYYPDGSAEYTLIFRKNSRSRVCEE